MKRIALFAVILLHFSSVMNAQDFFKELPLGAIQAKGWVYQMLDSQRTGSTGALDALYPQVMGERNGWLGGDGDQWERGPYWIDGLLPLAYILGDDALKAKVQPWVEWALKSQREDGFFGPAVNYEPESGLQRNNSEDWWPRMVVLKILKQYYMATQDERVIPFFTNYFHYQLKTLPSTPLGNWTFWSNYRVCDNMDIVYWTYQHTQEGFLLELMDLLYEQGFSFVNYIQRGGLAQKGSIHCVNLAQGIKEPVIYYQRTKEESLLKAVKQGLADIRQYNGQPQGMYGGDETLHGNNPTQGSELCSAIELMYSLERMLQITGDVQFADHLEKVAFNALPTQISDDFMTRQYFQQANQVIITRDFRNFNTNHNTTDIVFGLLTGYPCCTSNMHQGWPKFVQNLWYATQDNGVAALVYAPSKVQLTVANGVEITLTEETAYPFEESIRFQVDMVQKKVKQAAFPVYLRIPQWCKQAVIAVNGQEVLRQEGGTVARVERTWNKGDLIELQMPMHVFTDRWYENSVAVHRGPLTFALRMEEEWKRVEMPVKEDTYGTRFYYEVTSPSPWNFALLNDSVRKPNEAFKVVLHPQTEGKYPWNLENAPIELQVQAKAVPSWTLYNHMAGPVPFSPMNYQSEVANAQPQTIRLIPYGCTTLRISEFPVM